MASFVFRNALLLVLAALATASGRWVDSPPHELTEPTDLETSTVRKGKLIEGPNPRSLSCKGRIKKLAFTRSASDFRSACTTGEGIHRDDACSLCVKCADDGKYWFGTYDVDPPAAPCTYRCTSDPSGKMLSQACPADRGWTVLPFDVTVKPGEIEVPGLHTPLPGFTKSYEKFRRETYPWADSYGRKSAARHAEYRKGPFGG